MTQPQFVPLTAASLEGFFDAAGRPLGMNRCPTCKQTRTFNLVFSDGRKIRFSGDCGHGFEGDTPEKK